MIGPARFWRALFIVLFLFCCCGWARGIDYGLQFAANSGSTSNLLEDSSKIYDAYATSTVLLALYPLSSLEISLGGEHSYYRERTGLSSVTGQTGFTYIPLPRKSPSILYLTGSFSGIRYHNDFSGFDNNFGEVKVSGGYEITKALSARIGFAYRSTSYVSLDVEDKEDIEYFWGGNITLPGSIGADIEAGFARANYTHLFADTLSNPLYNIYAPDSIPRFGEKLWVFYYAPRISRQIAPRTGMNVVFIRRKFQNYDFQTIFGFSTQYLSPWASVWEGQGISANVKSYVIPRMILTAGAGYWDKTFLKTVEQRHLYYINVLLDRYNRRQDWQTKYYLAVQWPITSRSGLFIEPAARLDYTRNVSNEPLFFYTDFSVSATITFRL